MRHRKPPKPATYNTAKLGSCRYCGGVTLDKNGNVRKRANWHEDCLEEYKTIHWPQHTREVVWKRDKGQCAKCPTKLKSVRDSWDVDHRVPLIEAKGDIRYWKLENLDTLCLECHAAKTAQEATERAARKRAAKKPK